MACAADDDGCNETAGNAVMAAAGDGDAVCACVGSGLLSVTELCCPVQEQRQKNTKTKISEMVLFGLRLIILFSSEIKKCANQSRRIKNAALICRQTYNTIMHIFSYGKKSIKQSLHFLQNIVLPYNVLIICTI